MVVGDLNIRSRLDPIWWADGLPLVDRDRLDEFLRREMPSCTGVLPEGPTHVEGPADCLWPLLSPLRIRSRALSNLERRQHGRARFWALGRRFLRITQARPAEVEAVGSDDVATAAVTDFCRGAFAA